MSDPKFNVIVQSQEGRMSPASELDFQSMIVDGRWGDPNISKALQDRLQHTRKIKLLKGSVLVDGEGKKTILEEDALIPTTQFLWNEFAFLTRDFRLANLDNKDYKFAMHYTRIAADCLRTGMYRAFTVSLGRAATILELSQSKGGFLRNLLMKKHAVTESREISENPNLLIPKKNKGGM